MPAFLHSSAGEGGNKAEKHNGSVCFLVSFGLRDVIKMLDFRC